MTFIASNLNPYVNYHRPCLFPQTVTDKTGKQRQALSLRIPDDTL